MQELMRRISIKMKENVKKNRSGITNQEEEQEERQSSIA